MRIVEIVTASTIALGSATAAFAAGPVGQGSPAVHSKIQTQNTQSAGVSDLIRVAERHDDKNYKNKKRGHAKAKKRHENREAREERHNGHSRGHGHSKHDDDDDVKDALKILGAAAIISNLN